MKEDIKAFLSVSLAALNVPSTTPLVVDKCIVLDVREDPIDSQSNQFEDSIPLMGVIPSTAFHWHG